MRFELDLTIVLSVAAVAAGLVLIVHGCTNMQNHAATEERLKQQQLINSGYVQESQPTGSVTVWVKK